MAEESEPSVLDKPMSRREFLGVAGATAIAAGLAGCAPKSAVGSIGTPEAERVEYKKTLMDKPFSFTVDPEYLGATDPNDPSNPIYRLRVCSCMISIFLLYHVFQNSRISAGSFAYSLGSSIPKYRR